MIRKLLLRPFWYACIDFYLASYNIRCLKHRSWHEGKWLTYTICWLFVITSIFLCVFIELGKYFHDYDFQSEQAAYLARWLADQHFKGVDVNWKEEGF